MKIDTSIKTALVEIEGVEYPVAPKTVMTAQQLKRLADDAEGHMAEYELWQAQLRVLLGDQAINSLFPRGEGENLDRMERIYEGVMAAFDYNGLKAREARAQTALAQMSDALKQLAPLRELLASVDERYKSIAKME